MFLFVIANIYELLYIVYFIAFINKKNNYLDKNTYYNI